MYQTSEKPTVRIAEFSAQWEGRTIDGTYLLGQLLGSGENSVVFLTSHEGLPRALKLVYIEPGKTEAQLSQWRAAAKSQLEHPHLIRIFAMGHCELDALPLLYLTMEYADEDLSQVVPHRSLNADETREMLVPALSALGYLHKQGFVHAHLKPSNIMAVNDCLKLSSDGLVRAGAKDENTAGPYDPPERLSGVVSPAGDVWSLGLTLIEVLTGRRPSAARTPGDLPEPFATIVQHALERDARARWTVPQISKYLSDPERATVASVVPVRRKRIAPLGVWILLGVIVVVVAGVLIRQTDTSAPPPAAPTSVAKTADAPTPTQQTQPEPVKPSKKKDEPKPQADPVAEAPKPEAQEKPVREVAPVAGDAGTPGQPMPEVTGQARATIRGRVRVNIRADVNPAGAVTDAKVEGSGGGRYFSDLALKTVRQWKFEPVKVNGSETGQRWRVRFEFLKTGTKVQRQRLSP